MNIDMISIPGIDPKKIANNTIPSEPTHPGEILREEIEDRGITQTQLAKEIGMRVSLLNEIINGKRAVTVEYAMLLEAALGIDADFWLNLQANYNKAVIRKDSTFMSRLASVRRVAEVL